MIGCHFACEFLDPLGVAGGIALVYMLWVALK